MNVFNPYAEEIYSYLKTREKAVYRSINRISINPLKISQREFMVDMIKCIGEAYKLSVTAVHLSVSVLDRYMKIDDGIKDCHLEALCILSIVIAAKFEEDSVDIPMYSTLLRFLGIHQYTKDHLIRLESCILECLNYDMSRPTVANFAEYYGTFAVLETDCSSSYEFHNQLKDAVDLSLREYLDLSLHVFQLLQYLPSQIAAACLVAARYENQVETLWPPALTDATGYTLNSLRNILHALLSRMEMKSLQNSQVYLNESGYDSSSQPTTPITKKMKTTE